MLPRCTASTIFILLIICYCCWLCCAFTCISPRFLLVRGLLEFSGFVFVFSPYDDNLSTVSVLALHPGKRAPASAFSDTQDRAFWAHTAEENKLTGKRYRFPYGPFAGEVPALLGVVLLLASYGADFCTSSICALGCHATALLSEKHLSRRGWSNSPQQVLGPWRALATAV